MSNARHICLAPRAACALVFACVLAACGATIGSVPEKFGGLPESAPQRPAETMPFPNVYEPRPKRQATPLNDDEQKKLESELTRLRDEQNQRANPPPPEPPKKTAVPVKKDPVPAKKAAAKETAPAPAKKKQNDAVVPEQKGPVAPPKLIN